MNTFKNPIDQFISELGGTSKVAGELGLTPSVVSTWRQKGKIPNWRIAPVLAFAQKIGCRAIPAGLVPPPESNAPSKRAGGRRAAA